MPFRRPHLLAAAISLLLTATAVTPLTFAADAQPASISGPAVAWKFDTGKEIVASPTLADGVVYCGSTGYALKLSELLAAAPSAPAVP